MYLSDRKRRAYLSLPLPQNLYPKKLSLKDMRFLQKGPYQKTNRNNGILSICVNKGVKVLYEKHIKKACTQETPVYVQLWEKNIKVYKQCYTFREIPAAKIDLYAAPSPTHVSLNTGNISPELSIMNGKLLTENERKGFAVGAFKDTNALQAQHQYRPLQEASLPFSTSLCIFVQTIKTQNKSWLRKSASIEPSLRNKANAMHQLYIRDSKINIIKHCFLTPKRFFSLEKFLYFCRTFATPPLFVNGKNKYLYCRYLYNVEHLKNGLNSQMVHSQNLNKGGKKAISASGHEKKKIALFYGQIAKKDMQRLCKNAHTLPGVFFDNMYTLLESRVDVCVYRAGFSNTIAMARQQIRNGYFERNGKRIASCKIYNKPGDIISYTRLSGVPKNTILEGTYKRTTKALYQLWYSIDPKSDTDASQKSHDSLFYMQNSHIKPIVLYKDAYRDIFKKRQKNVQGFCDKKLEKKRTDREQQSKNGAYTAFDKKTYENFNYHALSLADASKWKYSRSRAKHLVDNSKCSFAHILTPSFFLYKNLCRYLPFSCDSPYASRERKKDHSSMLGYIEDMKTYPIAFFYNVYCAALLKHNVRKRQFFTGILNGERYFKTFEKNIHNASNASTWGQKPLHLEISYKTYTFIYLYRPQKIISSFCLDFDALKT